MEAGNDVDVATHDLGPLAWVLDELRKSLDSASSALRRFVRDTALARGTDMASVDGGQLRIARQQLHQAVGALEMVGLGAPAHILRSMEAAVQKFIERPELCNEKSSAKVERAGFALTEYLEGVLLGKAASAVALFPQYKDTQEIAGADRVHPADLWSLEWRWLEPATPAVPEAVVYDPAIRQKLDQSVLKLVKSGDPAAAKELCRLSLGLAATQGARQPKIFWKICAAYFEAVGQGLLPLDLFVKRAGSRILLQYASLAKGELGVSDRLAQDLVFFCSQAAPGSAQDAPALAAVRKAWNLDRFKPVDYMTPQYGRFDPVLLAQARKRISAAKETWSSLSGGDANKLKGVADQFNLVSDSLVKLHPASAPLAQGLTSVIDSIVRTARPPGAELAMEVATAVLYLEAAFEDLDPADAQLAARTARLAERLETVRSGGQAEPLEAWMEELYRRVSDRQTMGSVVGELRGTLGELEKVLDQYFRNLQDKAPLRAAPNHLAQMRGVLSVLGLDQAAQAVQRMRESVEEIIVTEVDEERVKSAGTFERLGNNLGALGFLIDMLNYQPSLAKKLFVYNDDTGELKPLMGRVAHAEAGTDDADMAALAQDVDAVVSGFAPMSSPEALTAQLDSLAAHAVLAEKPAIANSAREAAAAVAHDPAAAGAALEQLAAAVKPAPAATPAPAVAADIEEDDLLDIFLEEAREVVGNGLAAIDALQAVPTDLSEMTTLRRAFHTLKGSSRMVGLNEFGEAAWSMEQVLNTWLADQKPAGDELRVLAREAMQGFGRWVEDIAAHTADGVWKAGMFASAADALRLENRLVALTLPTAGVQPEFAVLVQPEFVPAIERADEPVAFILPDEVPAQAGGTQHLPEAQQSAEPIADAAEDFRAIDVVAPDAALDDIFAAGSFAAEVSLDVTRPLESESVAAAPTEAAAEEFVLTFDDAAAPDISFDISSDISSDISFDIPDAVSVEALEPEALPATELPVDIEAVFTLPTEPSEQALAQPTLPVPEVIEGDAVDFGIFVEPELAAADSASDDLILDLTAELRPAELQAAAALDNFAAAVQSHAEAVPDESLSAADLDADDQIKVIGSLRIGIPLYNVYLNEADEWSRRLAAEVAEWAFELDQRVPDSTVGLAHALAGSSATVGFESLSDIARALENALGQTQRLAWATQQHERAFTNAAEEIRRLLHQFAAGFLKEPNPGIVRALTALQQLEIPPRAEPEGSDPYGEFAEDDVLPVQPVAVPAVDQAGGESVSTWGAELPLAIAPQEAAPQETAHYLGASPVSAPEEPVTDAVTEAIHEPQLISQSQDDAATIEAAPEIPAAPALSEKSELSAFPAPALNLVASAAASPAATARTVSDVSDLSDDEEDLDIEDAVDLDLFGIFEEEAIELMPQLGGALRQWTARPENRSARDEVLRALHTLKGSARLAGALRLGELAHRMESEIESLGSDNVATADIEPLLHRFDVMQANLDGLRARGGLPAPRRAETEVEADDSTASTTAIQPQPAFEELQPTVIDADATSPLVDVGPIEAAPLRRGLIARPVTSNIAPQRASANHTVRVRSQLLDRLMNQAGEVMITRSRLESELRQLRGSLNDLTGNLDRLRSQLRDIELQAETQMQSRLAQSKDSGAGFDPLEFDRFTRVQELTRMMAESVNDVATVQRNIQRVVESTEDDLIAQARQTRELQRDLLRTRMVEFEGISDRLYRVVRLASKETGKQVKLDITGGSIEMDRGVLDRMAPAFEHLLRNCVAHGIEDPAVREAAGKDPAGTILIGLHHEGNDVSVEFRDDGAGLNLQRIRDKAVEQGLVSAVQALSDSEAAQMIFMPGFSTAAQVTELAGRGIGMDVVRAEVNALGGRIETNTTPGQGTSFKLVLPLTTAVTQVVMIRAGNLTIGVPANLIEIVRRASATEVEQSYSTGTYDVAGEPLPFYWAGALLQASQHSTEPQGKTLPVVIFRSAAQRIAVHVDEVLGNQEVVVKNLGPQLARLPGLAGMTVLASGAVVLIYNPVALTTVYGDQARRLSMSVARPGASSGPSGQPLAIAPASEVMPATPSIPLVLVVDDSITVRRVTQRLLQREGYRVALAADGLQALERLAEEKPTVVLSDIEMPRMDGFDLARNIRADGRLRDLPIIMITSRIAEKHREHAKELGVDHYLGKPYSEEELLSLVKHYSRAVVLA